MIIDALRIRIPTGLFALAFVAVLAYYKLVGGAFAERCLPMGMPPAQIQARTIDCTRWLHGAYNTTLRNALATGDVQELAVDADALACTLDAIAQAQ